MKIISKFKDYYDFYSTVYGVDNRCVYNRELWSDSVTLSFSESSVPIRTLELADIYSNAKNYHLTDYDLSWVLICGRRFLVYRKKYEKQWNCFTPGCEISPLLPLLKSETKNNWYFNSGKHPVEFFMGEFSYKNLEFNIKNKSPIVVIQALSYHEKNAKYVCSSPQLGQIQHLASLYPAEQIYQDITYFFNNQVHGSPDTNPPVKIDDKLRLEMHGFDKKVSFRPTARKE